MSKTSMKWIVTTPIAVIVLALAMVGGFWQTGQAGTLPTVPTLPTIPGTFTAHQNRPKLAMKLGTSYFKPSNVMVHWVITPSPSGTPTEGWIQIANSAIDLQEYGAGDKADVNVELPASLFTQIGTIKLSIVNLYGQPNQGEFGSWIGTIDINKLFLPTVKR